VDEAVFVQRSNLHDGHDCSWPDADITGAAGEVG
jgi:hypothetical protein